MRGMSADPFLADALAQLRKYKSLGEAALAQLEPAQLMLRPDAESNSVAILVKHMAGNMRSRWTDFLTTDGEKPNRDRDSEFELRPEDTRAHLTSLWEDGWSRVFQAISPLKPEDLARTVFVRKEAHTVLEAIHRQTMHYAQHVGQIVLLCKHYSGPRWNTLSIPKGKSKEFDVAKSGMSYKVPQK
jgi:hypothetical protein